MSEMLTIIIRWSNFQSGDDFVRKGVLLKFHVTKNNLEEIKLRSERGYF